jgi:hypothetical protein
MTKKVWTASDMGRKGIRKMLEKFDPDPVKARKKIAKLKKKLGVSMGARPAKYAPCPDHAGGRHRFYSGLCSCGERKKTTYNREWTPAQRKAKAEQTRKQHREGR